MNRILIVDDEPEVLRAVASCVHALGYETVECSRATEALQKLHNEEFDLLITDQRMPEMSGLELASILRRERSTVPIIMVTASWSHLEIDLAHEAGISTILSKPFDFEDFKAAFETYVARPREFGPTRESSGPSSSR